MRARLGAKALLLAALLEVGAVACARQPPARPVAAASGAASQSPAALPSSSPWIEPVDAGGVSAACSAAEGGAVVAPSKQIFDGWIAGRWVLCTTPSIFGTGGSGLDILPDGRWTELEKTASGGLTPATGWGERGTWTTVDVRASGVAYQLNLVVDRGGELMTLTTLARDVPKMRLTEQTHTADYVKLRTPAGWPSAASSPAASVVPVAVSDYQHACGTSERNAIDMTSQQQFTTALVGRWLLCKRPSVFGTSEAGIEFLADGTWFKLSKNAEGALVRLTGWDNQGTWTIVDPGDGRFQLNILIDGGGEVFTLPVFGAPAPRMHVDNNGRFIADYVKVVG